MKILGEKVNLKTVLITGAISSILFFGLKNTLNFIQPDLADKVDITHKDNIVNSLFQKIYTGVTGSEDMPGEDVHDGVQNIKSWWDNLWKKDSEIIETDNSYNIDYGSDYDGFTETVADDPNWK